MFTNYIKTALRNFYRNKSITIIKIIGLALGLAAIFFILIYIIQETSYNKFLKNNKLIYRIISENHIHGWNTRNITYQMRDELKNNYPEVAKATRIFNFYQTKIKHNQEIYPADNYICTDGDFFDIFQPQMLYEDISNFDNDYNQVVISKSMALKYFGKTDVINKVLTVISFDKEFNLVIKAVFEDFPVNSTIRPDYISPIELGMQQVNKMMVSSGNEKPDISYFKTNWDIELLETYILLKNKSDYDQFDHIFKDIIKRKYDDPTERDFYLQNVTDVYLHSEQIISEEKKGDLSSIYIFSVVAFFVLIIASINYVILSTSQAISRTKEIGIRKITGANKKDLFKMIITESVIISLVAFILSFIIIEQARPIINQLLDQQIYVRVNWKFISGTLFILLLITIVPGLYLMYYINRITPIKILNKQKIYTNQKLSLRKVLITLQFVIFLCLIVGSIGIIKQVKFAMNSDLGYSTDHKLVIPVAELVQMDKYQTVKQELLKVKGIKNISGAMWLPPSNSKMSVNYKDPKNPDESFNIEALFVDPDFIETLNLKMIEGNRFSFYGENAPGKVIINQQAKRYFKIGEEIWGNEIVGVVNDFKFHSFHEKEGPMFLVVGEHMVRSMVIDYDKTAEKSIVEKVKIKLSELYPDMQFNYSFLSDNFNDLYQNEERQAFLISIFSFLAIFIASIGLLGLTIFTTKRQTKNIAIRKVNGATVTSIIKLLISDYFKLIVIALIIATPISYYLLHEWLQNFAYKTSINWWIFALAGVIALTITILTISWYCIKAAHKNPVDSLRYE
jgi:putative ABC transport system permease protein